MALQMKALLLKAQVAGHVIEKLEGQGLPSGPRTPLSASGLGCSDVSL